MHVAGGGRGALMHRNKINELMTNLRGLPRQRRADGKSPNQRFFGLRSVGDISLVPKISGKLHLSCEACCIN